MRTKGISIQMNIPQAVNLILLDLPGIIQNDPDPLKVTAIKELVESYLKQGEYIILAITSVSHRWRIAPL